MAAAIDEVGILERRSLPVVTVLADYQQAGRLESDLRESPHRVVDVRYGADVEIDVALYGTDPADFTAWVAEITAGQALCELQGKTTVEVEVGADGTAP